MPLKGGAVAIKDADWFRRFGRAYAEAIERMPFTAMLGYLAAGAVLVLLENHAVYRLFYWLAFERRGVFTAETSFLPATKDAWYRFDLAEWQAFLLLPAARAAR